MRRSAKASRRRRRCAAWREHQPRNWLVSITWDEAWDTIEALFLDGALAVPAGPMKLASQEPAKPWPRVEGVAGASVKEETECA